MAEPFAFSWRVYSEPSLAAPEPVTVAAGATRLSSHSSAGRARSRVRNAMNRSPGAIEWTLLDWLPVVDGISPEASGLSCFRFREGKAPAEPLHYSAGASPSR